MIQIKTKKEVIYDTRANKLGTIVLELELKTGTDAYSATIKDYVQRTVVTKDENEEDVTGTFNEFLCVRTIQIPVEQINFLFDVVEDLVPADLPYTEKEVERTKQAFLFYVKNDFIKDGEGKSVQGKTIYNLDPDQWEILN